ncbi:hypothetical protein BT93_J1890 [Corymbia citriodora subsp. variegata]|nr:hypothetical protein BT93_J1890 [Corymbia citriodora subsp. variegata]KAF8011413.1 hypothetical protein BT93_J1890 [Corymbia citriodora subsp. variegata]
MAATAPPSPSPPLAAEAERSDGNAGSAPAWSKPAGGGGPGPGPGGEADESGLLETGAWPALSGSARASASSPSKSSPESPAGELADGSSELSVSKGTETNKVETPNHVMPARQRLTRRNSSSPSGVAPASTGPFDSQQTNPASRNGHQQPRSSSFRNRSGGQHTRAANYHQMFRHDQRHREWHSRQVGGFDPRFMRPVPPPPLPFPIPHPYYPLIPSQAFPFGNPLAYPEMAPHFFPTAPPDIQASGPFAVPPPLAVNSQLHLDILRQIEYYFSKENLIKDLHFRKKWNGQGWVHISIIAAFKKVSSMTSNINLILDAVRNSTMLEIQGDMVRKRDDWERWLVPRDFNVFSDTSPPVQ